VARGEGWGVGFRRGGGWWTSAVVWSGGGVWGGDALEALGVGETGGRKEVKGVKEYNEEGKKRGGKKKRRSGVKGLCRVLEGWLGVWTGCDATPHGNRKIRKSGCLSETERKRERITEHPKEQVVNQRNF